jgi:hypothetical protein
MVQAGTSLPRELGLFGCTWISSCSLILHDGLVGMYMISKPFLWPTVYFGTLGAISALEGPRPVIPNHLSASDWGDMYKRNKRTRAIYLGQAALRYSTLPILSTSLGYCSLGPYLSCGPQCPVVTANYVTRKRSTFLSGDADAYLWF